MTFKPKQLNLILVIKITIFLLCFSSFLLADLKVTYFRGNVFLENSRGKKKITSIQTKIKSGDIIVTEKSSFLVLKDKDGSIIKIAPNTKFEIETIKTTRKSRKKNFFLRWGKIFSYVSKTGKNSDVKFVTPTVVAGIRGTKFFLSVDQKTQTTDLYLEKGEIDIWKKLPKQEARVGQRVSLQTGQVMTSSVKNNDVKIRKVTKKDKESSYKSVPVSVGTLRKVENDGDSKVKEQGGDSEVVEKERLVDELKDEIRNTLNEQKEQHNSVKENNLERRAFEVKTGRRIDGYTVDQLLRKDGNSIKIITLTTHDSKNQQTRVEITAILSSGDNQQIAHLIENQSDELILKQTTKISAATEQGGKVTKDDLVFIEDYDTEDGETLTTARVNDKKLDFERSEETSTDNTVLLYFKDDNDNDYIFSVNRSLWDADGNQIVDDVDNEFSISQILLLGRNVKTVITDISDRPILNHNDESELAIEFFILGEEIFPVLIEQ